MQKRYVEALRARHAAAARLDAGRHELAAAWTALCEEVAEGATFGQLHQTRAWCGELERRCDQLEAALKSALQATHVAWREMSLATRDREAVDRLRAKCRRAYDRGLQRDEQKQLDEMGLRLSLPGLGSPRGVLTSDAFPPPDTSAPRGEAVAMRSEQP